MIDGQVSLVDTINSQSARIAELEREIKSLKDELRSRKAGLTWPTEEYFRISYLEGKMRRQAAAIDRIQKKGWQPQLIIREVPYSDDEYLWNEQRPQSRRRPKRHPSEVIQEV